MNCRNCEQMMVEALYDELEGIRRGKFEAHLESCDNCRQEYGRLSATLGHMDKLETPEIVPGYWAGYMSRLEALLKRQTTRRPSIVWPDWLSIPVVRVRPLWVPLAAALMLVITGVFIGRTIFTGDYLNERNTQTAAVLDPAVVAEFNELAGQYLDRAQMILMGLDNLDAGDEVFDLRHQQRVSRQLLRQGRVLKSHQAVVTDQQYGILVDEIERVLLQFANSEQDDFDWTVRLIQEGIEENSILLKITLTRLDRKGARPRQVPLKTSSIIA